MTLISDFSTELYWNTQDVFGGNRKYSRKLSSFNSSHVEYDLYTQSSAIVPAPSATHVADVVPGKPYLATIQITSDPIHWQYWALTNTDVSEQFRNDTLLLPIYLAFIPPNFSTNSSAVLNGIRLSWPDQSATSGIAAIRILAQDVYNPTSWQTITSSTNTNLVSFIDQNAIAGRRYIYRIQLLNSSNKVFEESYCFWRTTIGWTDFR